jgi:hypothetical protein
VDEAVLRVGEKVHVITRRLFAEDLRRHFVGEITAVTDHLMRVQGYAFIFHAGLNQYHKRPDMRIRVFSLTDAGNIVNVIPDGIKIESLNYRFENQRMVITDEAGFSLDINEFGPIT